MKKISINPILVLIVILLTAIVFFSPRVSPQIAEKKTLEDKMILLETENTGLKTRNETLEQQVQNLRTEHNNLKTDVRELSKRVDALDKPKEMRCPDCD